MRNSKQADIIVEELCHIIKYGEISIDNRTKLQATMELNIDYYVEDSEKRDELMEMIDVETSQDSEYFKWQETYGKHMQKIGEKIGEKKGIKIGEKNGAKRIMNIFLESMSPEEIEEKIGMPKSEIEKIAR